MKGKAFIVIGLAVCLLCGMVGGLFYLQSYEKVYYTQVDNSNIQKLSSSSDMKYQYELKSYDENGRSKKLKFKTYKELREDAYLLLVVRSAGVYKWEEVKFDELPKKVQDNIAK